MKGFVGIDDFVAKLEGMVGGTVEEMRKANLKAAEAIQREVVRRVPVDTGRTRDAFAAQEAIGMSGETPAAWRFGLLTEDLKRKGYRSNWIEYGTKGYQRGGKRFYKVFDKRGRLRKRYRKIKRDVPARPAQPFFRPGVEAAMPEVKQIWREAIRRSVRNHFFNSKT
jgi:HK97 gp10 family phage protein